MKKQWLVVFFGEQKGYGLSYSGGPAEAPLLVRLCRSLKYKDAALLADELNEPTRKQPSHD